jgi:hypothetical protein
VEARKVAGGAPYSITSSARVSRIGGTLMPSALAVLRLIARSYLVGIWTGRAAGFSPDRRASNHARSTPFYDIAAAGADLRWSQ